ncbi:MAG: serine-type D-Ala-D-Ala carboxypeptidase, partial [Syntrophales bacterium]|nr:serine-type D-Ala-D-Ala carboxypeptidase [Syntrophales bacterium]
ETDLGGNVERFVEAMNAKARQLGMKNTTFRNPHGLPAPGQLTTARDMMVLAKAYLEHFPSSLQVHSLPSYTYHNIKQYNRNRLLGNYPGADGIKTGFVCKSGYNIAATAKRGDHRLLAVVMGARSPGIRTKETARLLDEGFRMVNGRGA